MSPTELKVTCERDATIAILGPTFETQVLEKLTTIMDLLGEFECRLADLEITSANKGYEVTDYND